MKMNGREAYSNPRPGPRRMLDSKISLTLDGVYTKRVQAAWF